MTKIKSTFIDKLKLLENDVLSKTGSSLVIFRGNIKAKLAILGEAPGREENNRKVPFIGPSGSLLSKQLSESGINEDECIFINSVFRMPIDNDGNIRCPNNNEIEYYRPYVNQLIKEVNPEIILALGNSACYSLLNKKSITSIRGIWHGNILPTFHPSYILRNPDKIYFIQNDLQKVSSAISQYTQGML